MIAQQVYAEIASHIKQGPGAYRDWYVGIASDPVDRLFTQHQVPNRKDYWWIYRECNTNNDARAVEKDLLALGGDGGTGGGDNTSRFVYAYLKGPMTNP